MTGNTYNFKGILSSWVNPNIRVKESRWTDTTEVVATPVPPKIMEHYKDTHLDIDLLFVNKTPFLLKKSRDIGFIHCKAFLSKHDKRVHNGLGLIILDYHSRGFKVTSVFGDGAFEPLVE